MRKEEVKSYLIIAFVVIELLSMLFNFYFVNVPLGAVEYKFNFSIVFFCLGFFIVDVVADQFSPTEANKFIFYKLASQTIFLILGNTAIHVYGLESTQIATMLNKSSWMMIAGLFATYAGFYVMSQIMSYMKVGVYQGSSVFNRYLCSSLPGELIFSLIFTVLCFYQYNSMEEITHLFLTSAVAKIILSIMFASLMSLISRFTFFRAGNVLQSVPQESLSLD
jgi:uncharacterized PurR-regulated membrane protein YhhQ (DUF165 family)